MKKFFTLMALLALAFSANAQKITFGDGKQDSYEVDGFKMDYVDENGKVAVDANNCYFGTADAYEKFESRFKTGGKSMSSNNITLTVPSSGTLKVYVRTGSNSATDRNVVLTQGGETLIDAIVQESDAVEVAMPSESDPNKTNKVYPVISVPVQAGKVEVGYPVGSVNFYCFEFEAGGAGAPTSYDVTITSDPENNYFSGYEAFDPALIAEALGISASEVGNFISDEGQSNVYIKTADGMSNAYTGNHNEFWMNASGSPQGYGDEGSCWYIGLSYDDGEESGTPAEVNVAVGQMPNYFKKIYEDSDLHTVIYLVNGDKVITFNVTLHVNSGVPSDVPTLSELNIVKEYELPLDFIVGKSYEGKTYSATLDGIYEALGVSSSDLDGTVSENTYIEIVESSYDETTDITTYSLSGKLELPGEASGGGWCGRYINFDEANNKDIPLAINCPMEWGSSNNTFYIQDIKLAEGEFSILSGQYPGTFKEGDNDYTYLYILNGNNAARIRVQAKISSPEYVDPNQWTEVGKLTMTQTATKLSDYLQLNTHIDNMSEISELLECSADDIEFNHLSTDGSGFDSDLSDGWGAWVNELGYYCSWGADAAIMIAMDKIDDGDYQISTLQIPTSMSEKLYDGVSLNFPVYLVNPTAGKYYTIDFTYEVKIQEVTGEWTRVYAAAYDVQLIDSEGYSQDEVSKTELDLEAIAQAIGTNNPTLYGESWTEDENGEKTMKYSDSYSCTPYPGFWMAGDGISVGSWGNSPSYGMTYANGVITYYCRAGEHNVGDTFDSKFYLVNDENGKYALISLTVMFVDERGAIVDQVGSGSATVACSEETEVGGLYEGGDIDWSEVFTALGIDESELADCTWMITSSSGKLVNFNDSFEGENATFDAHGYFVDAQLHPEETVFALGFDYDTRKFTVSLMGNEAEEGVLYTTTVALKSSNGYYTFVVTAGSPSTLTGISSISNDATTGKVFDLSGRRIAAPTKGLYIINGKKVLVK